MNFLDFGNYLQKFRYVCDSRDAGGCSISKSTSHFLLGSDENITSQKKINIFHFPISLSLKQKHGLESWLNFECKRLSVLGRKWAYIYLRAQWCECAARRTWFFSQSSQQLIKWPLFDDACFFSLFGKIYINSRTDVWVITDKFCYKEPSRYYSYIFIWKSQTVTVSLKSCHVHNF